MITEKIFKPRVIADPAKAFENIRKMAVKAMNSSVIFRPHFKTHQSRFFGEMFRQAGVTKITVSSVAMAKYFADDGWDDITVAFPFNPSEYSEMTELQERCKLTITIPCSRSAEILRNICIKPVTVMIKIDAGYNRSGIRWDDHSALKKTYEILDSHDQITAGGLLVHAGDTYHATGRKEITDIYNLTLERLLNCRSIIGRNDLILSAGDTPSMSVLDSFNGINEIRPGNFVFYDLMQYWLGSCDTDSIAMIIACPVVDKRPESGTIVIHGGAVHLSKESLTRDGHAVFGMAVYIVPGGWKYPGRDVYVTSLSQEHGIISDPENVFGDIDIGEPVGIIPVHSCLTADINGSYLLTDGRTADHMQRRCIDQLRR